MIYYNTGSEQTSLSSEEIRDGLYAAFRKIGPVKKLLVIPPDFTRYHSRAGEITSFIYEYFSDAVVDILPALGTHAPMTPTEIATMFPGVPARLFRAHDWKNGITTIGTLPGTYLKELSQGKVDYPWRAQVNKLLVEGGHDLILSVGQVVPHEVAGMANHSKNIYVGTGGPESIHKSHYLGAVCDMEKIMGRTNNPVRALLNQASERFSACLPPVVYALTVIGKDPSGSNVLRGLYVGDGQECFEQASELSRKVNVTTLEHPLHKVVVHLDASEYKSTWLGNKAIYRTRMALADGAELLILAPGVRMFGEDEEIDKLIRAYGYQGTHKITEEVNKGKDLFQNLAAAAHLIHGSPEGRFKVVYCPGHLSRAETEAAGFHYASYEKMKIKYNPEILKDGMNVLPDGERIYYISNPGLGLWSTEEKIIKQYLK